jgi:hypothetical protein
MSLAEARAMAQMQVEYSAQQSYMQLSKMEGYGVFQNVSLAVRAAQPDVVPEGYLKIDFERQGKGPNVGELNLQNKANLQEVVESIPAGWNRTRMRFGRGEIFENPNKGDGNPDIIRIKAADINRNPTTTATHGQVRVEFYRPGDPNANPNFGYVSVDINYNPVFYKSDAAHINFPYPGIVE